MINDDITVLKNHWTTPTAECLIQIFECLEGTLYSYLLVNPEFLLKFYERTFRILKKIFFPYHIILSQIIWFIKYYQKYYQNNYDCPETRHYEKWSTTQIYFDDDHRRKFSMIKIVSLLKTHPNTTKNLRKYRL